MKKRHAVAGRTRKSATLWLRFLYHDIYGFHVSVSYFLRYLTDEQNTELMNFLTEDSKDMPKEFELRLVEFAPSRTCLGLSGSFA